MGEQLESIKILSDEFIKIGEYKMPILISEDIPKNEIWIFDGDKIHKIINIGLEE